MNTQVTLVKITSGRMSWLDALRLVSGCIVAGLHTLFVRKRKHRLTVQRPSDLNHIKKEMQ